MNILQEILNSQEELVKVQMMVDILYNGISVKALSVDDNRLREQTDLGSEEFTSATISIYKSDVLTINLKSDLVVMNSKEYTVCECQDGESLWHITMRLKEIKERTRQEYRR